MKPSIRTIDYTALVQDGIMTIYEVPKDIQAEVSKWLGYFVTGKQEPETEAKSNESNNQAD